MSDNGPVIVHISFSPWYRLRLNDGRYVYMEWHNYCGPSFWRDKWLSREIDKWWDDPAMCAAVDWFCKRGCKA